MIRIVYIEKEALVQNGYFWAIKSSKIIKINTIDVDNRQSCRNMKKQIMIIVRDFKQIIYKLLYTTIN